jgi:3-oxoacyl-[acyl-carrier protein] reductase
MQIIRGKKAMVTGAASGIGRAIALELAKEGTDLFLVDIDVEKLAAVAGEARGHGVEVINAVCDLAEPDQISAAVNRLHTAWGELNILINNAGIVYYGPTHLMTAEQWRRITSVNLLAPIQLVHELLPILLAAKDAHIVNVSSMFGLVPWRRVTAYQTTKFAMVGFSSALRAEYNRANLGVTALCPGFAVRTSLLDAGAGGLLGMRPSVPLWMCTTPEHIAARAVRAIRKNQGLVVITAFTHVYWRLTRLFPGLVDWFMRSDWRIRKRLRGRTKIKTRSRQHPKF